jgi:DNA repair exonuclease SbcCD ATPase subunit
MEKEHHNPLTLADLTEALKGLATKEDLNALATQEALNALTTKVTTVTETVAETKESVTELTGLMKDTLQELTATHEDVRYVRTTVTALARSDAAQEAAIESLRKRLERVEKKVGMTT